LIDKDKAMMINVHEKAMAIEVSQMGHSPWHPFGTPLVLGSHSIKEKTHEPSVLTKLDL
jgi:hypothetical protein